MSLTRPLTGLALLAGLLLAGPVAAQTPDPDTTEEEEIPEVTEEQRTEALSAYDEAMESGEKTKAADALLPILDNEELSPLHGEAWVALGDLLVSFDMQYSALIAYANGIEANPETAASKVGLAMDLAADLGDDALLGPVLATNVGVDVDPDTRSRMAYLAARHYFTSSELGMAKGILMMVSSDSPVYPDAQLLKGVLLAQQGKHSDALKPLLLAQETGRSAKRGERFVNMVELNVARAFFGAGNYPRAIEHYNYVDRGSEYWPHASSERAWSHFRLQDMNGTVALLMNHKSPYLIDWYYPEADLLRAYALFLLCKFPDASKEIDRFIAKHEPIMEVFQRELGTMGPQAAWDDVRHHLGGQSTRMPAELLRRYETEDRIHAAIATVDKADDELSRLANVSANPFAARATKVLQERRDELVANEGGRVLGHMTIAKSVLSGMMQDVQVTKLDMMQFETRMYERASITGEIELGDRVGQIRKLRRTSLARVWPYEGEYWADELGYYRISARPDCPSDMITGGE